MRTFLQIILLTVFSAGLFAQGVTKHQNLHAPAPQVPSERTSKVVDIDRSIPSNPLSPLVAISGAVDMGVTGKWYIQTVSGGLHNIQVDPSNPNNIHACVMQAFNTVPSDTLTDSYYLNRRVYYVFSSDGGATWTAPKEISNLRTGYPRMILMQRAGKYVPIIAAHRNVSATETEVMTCLFIEAGNPGDGNFTTVEGSRVTYLDGLRDVIWPSIALSKDGTKAYVVASAFDNPIDYLQFGYFTFNEDKTNATFSGWKEGPAPNDDRSLTNGGQYHISVSESGKIGVVWQNLDYGTPDLGLYYSESTNEGTNWSAPINIFFATATNYQSSTGEDFLHVSGGVSDPGADFFFDGEDPVVVFAGEVNNMKSTGGSYVPALGNLMFWRKGMAAPTLLLWPVGTSTTDLGDPLYDGSFLSGWGTSNGFIDPGGTNLMFPTIAVGSDPKKITVYFEAWVQDDFGEIGEFPSDPTLTAAPFHSIWKMTTLDGGTTWKEPIAVYANDLSSSERIDYRYPSVSTFNPSDVAGSNFHMMFTADDAPGNNNANGENNFSDVQSFFAKNFTAKAKKTVAPHFSLEQNYPNPVVSGNESIIPLNLASTEHVTLSITDVMGRELMTVFTGQLGAGSHELHFSTATLAAGMYQYIVKTGDVTLARSFTVVQ